MVSAATAFGVGVIVLVHTAIAAVGARYFRITLSTRWGSVLYTLILTPVVYVATTLAFGVLGFGAGAFDNPGTLIAVTWVFPFFLGLSVDLFWIPPPEAYESSPQRANDQ
jgi:hypothetical protein